MRCGLRFSMLAVVLAIYCALRVMSTERDSIRLLEKQNAKLEADVESIARELVLAKEHEASALQLAKMNVSSAQYQLQQLSLAHQLAREEVAREERARPLSPPEEQAGSGSHGGQADAMDSHQASSCEVFENKDLPGWDLTDVVLIRPSIGMCCDACMVSGECKLAVMCGSECWLKSRTYDHSLPLHSKLGCTAIAAPTDGKKGATTTNPSHDKSAGDASKKRVPIIGPSVASKNGAQCSLEQHQEHPGPISSRFPRRVCASFC